MLFPAEPGWPSGSRPSLAAGDVSGRGGNGSACEKSPDILPVESSLSPADSRGVLTESSGRAVSVETVEEGSTRGCGMD